MKSRLTEQQIVEKYIKLLEAVNNEYQTLEEREVKMNDLSHWSSGVHDASGLFLNGDYHYMNKEKYDDMPMCCGVFLDWKSKL